MKAGRYIKPVRVTSALAITNAYAAAKVITIPLDFFPSGATFRGRLQSLVVQISSISGAASIDFKITEDALGDLIYVPNTNALIDTGITTATKGAIAAKIDIDVGLSSGDTLYLFMKTNAGTATVDLALLCWEE